MACQRKIPFGYQVRDGLIQPHPQEAGAVRYIFGQYRAGASLLTIAEDMTRQGIRYHQHTAVRNKNMVKRVLEDEKYIGDAVLQKTFSEDLFERRQVKNEGQLPKYYVHDCHPAIIDRDTFRRVQEELARRSSLRRTSSKGKTQQASTAESMC